MTRIPTAVLAAALVVTVFPGCARPQPPNEARDTSAVKTEEQPPVKPQEQPPVKPQEQPQEQPPMMAPKKPTVTAKDKAPVMAPAPASPAVDAQRLADFKARVDKYVQLRKKADDSAPPLKETNDAARIKLAQQGLAERIGAARAGVKPGEIFTPEIAATFRKLLGPEMKEPGTRAAMKEDKPAVVSFKVNGPYPDKQPVGTVPVNILSTLPALPKGIEYRFIEKHLILRDSNANLIIDYIPNAIS